MKAITPISLIIIICINKQLKNVLITDLIIRNGDGKDNFKISPNL